MSDELVRTLLTVIDLRDWDRLAGLVTPDVRYDRPGYPGIVGRSEFLRFYRETRIIAGGAHRLESLLTDGSQGFCWGVFVGVSRDGAELSETFADWYGFDGDQVSRRRSFFYRPAI